MPSWDTFAASVLAPGMQRCLSAEDTPIYIASRLGRYFLVPTGGTSTGILAARTGHVYNRE